MNLSKINGWQRLYFVVCVLFAAWTLYSTNVPKNTNVDLELQTFLVEVSPKYAEHIRNAKPPSDVFEFINPDDLGNRDEFKMPDGEVFYEDKGLVTQSQVEQAYKLAREKLKKEYWDRFIKVYSDALMNYLLSIAALYALGWSAAWVRRGFNK